MFNKLKSLFENGLVRASSLFPNMYLFVPVYLLVVAVLYFGAVWLPGKIFGYTLNGPAVVYILLSGSSIILTTWGEVISIQLLRIFIPDFERNRAQRTLSERKIRFLLIIIYFVMIIAFSLASLVTAQSVFGTDKMDFSVIQSFATYIAYDRMIRNYATLDRGKQLPI